MIQSLQTPRVDVYGFASCDHASALEHLTKPSTDHIESLKCSVCIVDSNDVYIDHIRLVTSDQYDFCICLNQGDNHHTDCLFDFCIEVGKNMDINRVSTLLVQAISGESDLICLDYSDLSYLFRKYHTGTVHYGIGNNIDEAISSIPVIESEESLMLVSSDKIKSVSDLDCITQAIAQKIPPLGWLVTGNLLSGNSLDSEVLVIEFMV